MSDPTIPDDFGFDALDTALGERLREAAPTAPDVDATLAGMRPGLARARRRHHVMVTGAAAICALAFVAVGAVALRSGGGGDVKTPPATRPDTTTTAPTSVPTTTPTSADEPGATAPGGTTGTSIDDHSGGSGSSGSGSSNSGSGSSGSSNSGSGSGSSSGSSSSGSGTGSDD